MGRARRISAIVITLLVAGVTVGACEIQRAQEASDAQASMVGMSKEQVLACMGSPVNAAMTGGTEVWTYDSGNGRTDTIGAANAWGGWGHAFGIASSTSTSRYCKVNVVMTGGRVSRVNYTGPTGGLLTEGEQCAFAVQNCLRQAVPYSPALALPQQPSPQSYAPPTAASAGAESTPAIESSSPAPHPACTNEDKELARMAREDGYQYRATCN